MRLLVRLFLSTLLLASLSSVASAHKQSTAKTKRKQVASGKKPGVTPAKTLGTGKAMRSPRAARRIVDLELLGGRKREATVELEKGEENVRILAPPGRLFKLGNWYQSTGAYSISRPRTRIPSLGRSEQGRRWNLEPGDYIHEPSKIEFSVTSHGTAARKRSNEKFFRDFNRRWNDPAERAKIRQDEIYDPLPGDG